jgi:AraC family transcriptional regulator
MQAGVAMQQVSKTRYLGTTMTSRTLSNFILVESRYAAGQELRSHLHERPYISIVLQGSYKERCGSSDLSCDVGQVILHAAGEVHSNHFYEDGHCINLEIQPHFADRLCQYGIDRNTRIAMNSRHYAKVGLTLRSEAAKTDSASELVIEGLAMEVLAQLIRNRLSEPAQRNDHWLERVNEMLHDRYREPITLRELADYSQVHPVHVARAFKKRYGYSVGDYVRRLRVAAACSDIAVSDMSIAEIANRNGFSDQSHLCRTVKAYTGKSPRQLRPKQTCMHQQV